MQDGGWLRVIQHKLTSTNCTALKCSCMAASCNITLPGCKLFHKWEIIVHNSAMLQVLGLGIEVWKHLLGYKKDNTFVYVFFTATFSNTTSPRGLPSSNHNCSSTIFTFTWPRLGQGNLAPRTIYTVPCLWMDLVILIFFCAYALCLHCEDSGKEREREGKKNKFDRSPVNYLPGVWLKWL